MSKSPIQIVLNSNDFIRLWDRTPGNSEKDFYEGKDQEFIEHKEAISNQLMRIKSRQLENEYSEISFAKIILKPSAIAKSHRPTGKIFRQNIAPVIGAGDLGEIFVELSPYSIDVVSSKIMQAEEYTKWVYDEKKKKDVAKPTALRSEVGAIEEIKPYTASDKRKFSLAEGMDWLSNPRTGGAYIVELFETPPAVQNYDNLAPQKRRLFRTFIDGLSKMGNGLVVSRIADGLNTNSAILGIRLEDSSSPSNVQLTLSQSILRRSNNIKEISRNQRTHGRLLKFLDDHPLVKRVVLPPIISQSAASKLSIDTKRQFVLPVFNSKKSYPKIAVVDGGVSSILGEWIEDKWGFLSSADKDENHGTFIGGLLVSGSSINGTAICNEVDGCRLIDLDILPAGDSFSDYFNQPLEFFKELEIAVRDLKARTGVRVFNFSLNVEEHVSTNVYSYAAQILDRIAEENDIIFIISAGNVNQLDMRREWPIDASEALSILATSRNDTLKTPSESCRNLSISALNPPSLVGIVPYAPSNYTCRGPGIRVGIKPDMAHIGGSGTRVAGSGHGLYSVNPVGNIVDGCGTSYAAPHVAKTIACLDHAIEGDVSRETLMALAIHHSTLPEVLAEASFKDIAKHLVGFGIPKGSEEILEGSDSSITLVFANRIYSGKKMSFNFNWPKSLVENGLCKGHARLTVISTPPFDHRYGAEFARVNIEGFLRQQQKDGKYKGRLIPLYSADGEEGHYEKDRIEHSFKWSPIKVSEKSFPKGVGPSTDWKLEVEYLARDGESLPLEGVPFTALLTISDPKGEQPVFTDMRQTLQSLGVQIVDIKTAARVVPRV